MSIVRRALEEPLRLIAANAGHEGAVVVGKVREMKADEGFNALTEKYENLVEAGVIDPTKVVRSALQNAASIASLLLTTEAIICEIPGAKGEKGSAAGCPPAAACTDAIRWMRLPSRGAACRRAVLAPRAQRQDRLPSVERLDRRLSLTENGDDQEWHAAGSSRRSIARGLSGSAWDSRANALAKALNVPAPRINDIVRERRGVRPIPPCGLRATSAAMRARG